MKETKKTTSDIVVYSAFLISLIMFVVGLYDICSPLQNSYVGGLILGTGFASFGITVMVGGSLRKVIIKKGQRYGIGVTFTVAGMLTYIINIIMYFKSNSDAALTYYGMVFMIIGIILIIAFIITDRIRAAKFKNSAVGEVIEVSRVWDDNNFVYTYRHRFSYQFNGINYSEWELTPVLHEIAVGEKKNIFISSDKPTSIESDLGTSGSILYFIIGILFAIVGVVATFVI